LSWQRGKKENATLSAGEKRGETGRSDRRIQRAETIGFVSQVFSDVLNSASEQIPGRHVN
jgi:hypothetical protein